MIDREKVLKGLEWVINDIEENGNINHAGQYLTEIKDALELLKNEPLPVLNVGKCGIYFGDCPHCGEKITKKRTSYCPYCGKRVQWE